MVISTAAAIIGSAAIGGVGSIIAGNKAAKGAKQAANVQAAAAKDASRAQVEAAQIASDTSQKQYDQSRNDLAPWREVGESSLYDFSRALGVDVPDRDSAGNTLEQGSGKADYSKFYDSPGYNFQLEEGNKSIERSFAARGLLNSGASAKALQNYGQGVAASSFDKYVKRLSGLAGLGQTATNTTVNLGANNANNQGQYAIGSGNAQAQGYLNAGAARASGYLGAANAQAGAIKGVAGAIQGGLGDWAGYQAEQNAYTSQASRYNALSGNGGLY